MELLNSRRLISARRAMFLAIAFLVLFTNANENVADNELAMPMCTEEYKPVVCSRGMTGTGVSTGGTFGAGAGAGVEDSAGGAWAGEGLGASTGETLAGEGAGDDSAVWVAGAGPRVGTTNSNGALLDAGPGDDAAAKEVFSNMCVASRDGDYTNATTECKLIELLSVKCTNPYALCASSNCTVNPDASTASCGCYGFENATSISSMRIALIPDEGVKEATIASCANSPTGCDDGPMSNANLDSTPVCEAIRDHSLWPGSDLVSTFAFKPQLPKLNNDETWTCKAKPGQVVPVCMFAPCRYSNSEPNVTCTCPLVAVTDEYDVATGGQTFPCADDDIVSEGSYMQVIMWDVGLAEPAWAVVDDAFETQAPTSPDLPSNAPTTRYSYYLVCIAVASFLCILHPIL